MFGKFVNDIQPLKIPIILLTLDVSHLEISGKEDKEEQLQNIYYILFIFEVFQYEISDNDINLSHSQNN